MFIFRTILRLKHIKLLLTVDTTSSNNQNEENEVMHEQPPAYEHPPDYDEASSLKIDLSPNRSSLQSSYKRSDSRSRYIVL